MSYIHIEAVRKTYEGQIVLKDIDFTIEEGEFLTMLGPSGCGKSTLLRAIAGLIPIDSGAIMVGGRNITPLSPKERQVGMVFQSYALFPNMSVFENIAFGLKMEKMTKRDYTPLVEEMIELIDLRGKENQYPAQLSGGQQQRVALARALVKRPKVLLLDEPLSALDAKIRRHLRHQIRDIQRKLKMTTIFVTHDQEEALTISDRIVVMNNGVMEQQGSPAEIYTAPATEFVAKFIGSYNVWRKEELRKDLLERMPSGELYAVRPESIRIMSAPKEEDIPFDGSWIRLGEGKVERSMILGNVMRYFIRVQAMQVIVDRLHDHDTRRFGEGANVELFMPAEDCRVLNALA
ncbi:ABC transporter ATP-binding protein [Paenibacillus guangzhouensis]|uniref:ABC transporter ATP-binding protein n=1 Tax=Paenibacillus guangzhouensis TaxID=1473112 RepID=UPI00126752CF|nr:ABC transporter ATP-binding protein [Paenibacillus guangzhouensis]